MQLRECYTILLSALGFNFEAAGYKEKKTAAETDCVLAANNSKNNIILISMTAFCK